MISPLLDKEFLHELDSYRNRITYARITSLTLDSYPIESVEGVVTDGNVTVDGNSAVRRICSLTMTTKNVNLNNVYWGVTTRVKIEIGIAKNFDSSINSIRDPGKYEYLLEKYEQYPDIIWFPLGVFILTDFKTSQQVNNYTITLSGKDKMCLLNGDMGGSLFASVDFGKEEYYDSETKITTISSIPIKTIIKEAVHAYAGDAWQDVIINDLDDLGLELLDYKGTKPLYLIMREHSNEDMGEVIQITINGSQELARENGTTTSLDEIGDDEFNPRSRLDVGDSALGKYTIFYALSDTEKEMPLSVAKVTNGQTCGYRYTDITYAGDLILNIGEPVTAMFDKLVAMLGNFEYFYNIDGRFVFQRKRTYLDKT